MKSKIVIALVLVMVSVMTLVGCQKTDNSDVTEATVAQGVNLSEAKEITIGAGRTFYQGPTSGIFVHGSTNIWQSLVMLNDDKEPEMQLAESITPSDDGLTWTIKLREGVKFHDDTELTSDVAIFNLKRLYHWSSGAKSYDSEFENTSEFGKIIDMSKIDELTFTVTHEQPIPDFDYRLAYANSAMFAMSSFDENKVIITPCGTGPYKYDNYDETSQIMTLKKFDDYWEGEPNLNTVKFQNIPDATTRLSALESGEIDVISDVGGILPQQAETVLDNDNLELKQRLVSTVHYYFMNTNEGKLFSDVNLRRALSLCIDRDSITKNILLNYGESAISVVSKADKTWVKDCGYNFDVEEAKNLKEESVGTEEVSCTILLNSSLLGRWPYQDTAVMIQAQLKEIGINANIETVDGATWKERLKEGSYDIAPQPFTVSSGEPNFFFTRNIKSMGTNNVSRCYGINDNDLDHLIDAVAVEPNKSKRMEYYNDIQALIKENEYVIPIWYDVTLYAMNKRVSNFNMDVTFCPDLYHVDLT